MYTYIIKEYKKRKKIFCIAINITWTALQDHLESVMGPPVQNQCSRKESKLFYRNYKTAMTNCECAFKNSKLEGRYFQLKTVYFNIIYKNVRAIIFTLSKYIVWKPDRCTSYAN